MKTHPVITLPDGRQVGVDAEMEINYQEEYFYCPNRKEIKAPGKNLSAPIGHKDLKIIFTIGFSLPNVEEIEIISEAEADAEKEYPFDETLSDNSLHNSCQKLLRNGFVTGASARNFTDIDMMAFAQWCYTNPEFNQGKVAGKGLLNNYMETRKDLTRPELSEILIEYKETFEVETQFCEAIGEKCTQDCHSSFECKHVDDNNDKKITVIKSILGKDNSGNNIRIRLKK